MMVTGQTGEKRYVVVEGLSITTGQQQLVSGNAGFSVWVQEFRDKW